MVKKVLVAAAVGASMVAAAPAVASEGAGPQWTPYRTSGFVSAAGQTCPFELSGAVVSDKERVRTTQTFPDGSPRYQQYTGQLVMRFTNTDTGASVVRNLTGRGDFEYFQDGGWTFILHGGHAAIGFHPGDDPGPAYDVISGSGWTVHADAEGHRTMTAGHGTVEDLCDTLG